MDAEKLAERIGADFYTGVPDSQLRPLCDYLMDTYGTDPRHHIIAANEGNCAALAAGYHLATGKIPAVYLQNSGEGNLINPLASLLDRRVYAIPAVFIIGWRGEPGVPDEPQHICQGAVTLKLLEDMDVPYFAIGKDTAEGEVRAALERFRPALEAGQSAAFVIRKGALSYGKKISYANPYTMAREEAIRRLIRVSGEDPVVSTTGKASRELFELREAAGQGHAYDFLTVGSMGHASSIALGIALQKPGVKVWCLDGDGALFMHMGAMAALASHAPPNLVHVVIENQAHETVGGMPTAGAGLDLVSAAKALGYPYAASASTPAALDRELEAAKAQKRLCFLDVKCAIGSRPDLGRPTATPLENKRGFMQYLRRK